MRLMPSRRATRLTDSRVARTVSCQRRGVRLWAMGLPTCHATPSFQVSPFGIPLPTFDLLPAFEYAPARHLSCQCCSVPMLDEAIQVGTDGSEHRAIRDM